MLWLGMDTLMGRPTKLTTEVQERILHAIRGGNYREVAAQWAGVGGRTLVTWMHRGEKEKSGPYCEFRRAVLEAEQAAEMRAVALVMQAAAEDPKHAQWWLERKFPERWGRKDRLQAEHTVSIQLPKVLNFRKHSERRSKGEKADQVSESG